MDFSILPNWPQTLPGETKQSWMMAAGRIQPLNEREWWELVRPSGLEPERPEHGTLWIGLPLGLGEINTIAPTWRLSRDCRRVYCPRCCVGTGKGKRWPTLIDWLDARQLQCVQHGCALVYVDPSLGLDPNYANLVAQPEMLCLYEWTRQWRRLEQSRFLAAQLECQWRRDLVHMVCRNWTRERCHSAAGIGAWELYVMGWYAQDKGRVLTVGCPGRLGELSAPERLGSLLLAYRSWRCFRREVAVIPPLPGIAWMWLARRWTERLAGSRRETFTAMVNNLTQQP